MCLIYWVPALSTVARDTSGLQSADGGQKVARRIVIGRGWT